MREQAFRIACKLDQTSKRADEFARLMRDLAENGEAWEVEEILGTLGGH